MASSYDPLGVISHCHVLGKVIYSKLCDEKIPWNAEAPEHFKSKFLKRVRDTSSLKNEIPRLVALNKESITAVDFHIFGDASIVASFPVVYAVVHQPSVTKQGLGVSKSRISKKNLTIPRLELASAHMTLNLIENVKTALKRCNIRSITGWTDITLILHWLNRQGLCKQFVANRVTKILEKEYIKWYYVPTKQNPTDIGNKGSLLSNIPDIWWKGPSWIAENSKYPDQPMLSFSKESEKEAKTIKNLLATTVKQKYLFDFLLDKYELQKVLRLSA